MGVRKILLSSACLAMLANASTWEVKYNDILSKIDSASESEKAALIKQAQEYEKAKNAELNLELANNNLAVKTNDFGIKSTSYQNQLDIFNEANKTLNGKKEEYNNHQNIINGFNNEINMLTSKNASYENLKQDYMVKNQNLDENIKKSQAEITNLDTSLSIEQNKYNAQKALLDDKSKNLELLKATHHANLEAYNKALELAGDENDESVRVAEVTMKENQGKLVEAIANYTQEKSLLDSIGLDIDKLNSLKNTISANIENMQNELNQNTSKISSLDNQIQTNIQTIEDKKTQIATTTAKIDSINKELETLLANTNTQKELLEQKLSELNTAKAELEQSKIQLEDAKNALDEAILAISDVADKKNQIEKSMGELASSAKDEVKDLVLLMATNPDLSNPSDKAKVQAVADRVADAVLEKEKSNATISSSGATLVQLNNMTKRLGEVRGFDAKVGAWVRGYGGKYSSDDSHFYYYSTQIGADNMLEAGYNARVLVGGLIGFDKINANTKTKSYSVGGYASYLHDNGSFLDVVLKYVNTSHEKLNHSLKDQNSVLLSVEAGHRFGIYDFYVEPSVELISGYVSKYEDKIGKKTEFSINSYSPLLLKPQVFVGGISDSFVYRVGVGAVLDTQNQKANVSIDDIVSGINASSSTKLDKNSYGFASVGGSYKINDKFIVNLGLERSFGGKLTNDYEINTTIRYGF